MATTIKTIKLTDLLVNSENYRFETVAGQKAAIDNMIQDQKDKLFNIAKHSVSNGLNPGELLMVSVSSHDKTKYNVLEGNRRIVSLKLIKNPDLIDDENYASLKKKFSKLHEESKGKIINDVPCVIFDDPSEADKWIKLKHTGENEGVGIVSWNATQIARFEEKVEGKSAIALQTLKLLERSPLVPGDLKNNLKNIKITNLDRLISDPDVRNFLGITVNNGNLESKVEEKEVIKGLMQVAKDLLNPNFKVKRIYHKEDREDYLKKFPKSSKPTISTSTAKPWQFNGSGSKTTSNVTSKPKTNPTYRARLIPKSCALVINNPKLNLIYYELQKKLNVEESPNAVAVTFRVFVELSLDCFIENNKLTTVSKDDKLITKVVEVANYLEANKLADKNICKGIRSAANNKNDLLGIETLHAYVHNDKFSPIPQNLIITWDNIQPFIEKVWGNTK